MASSELRKTVAVAAADVEFRRCGPQRCELTVGPRTYTLEAESPDSVAELLHDVVPRLRRSIPLGEQLSMPDIDRLTPFFARLRAMGVLLTPGPSTTIDDEPGRRLYSYVARRAADPDGAFTELRTTGVSLTGPAGVVDVWTRVLVDQGLTVAADGPLSIIVAADDATLLAANQERAEAGRAWLPVLLGPTAARIGPWVWVGETGCLRCHLPEEAEPLRRPGSVSGWATMQAGFLYWTGGLIAHQALRALPPRSAEPSWGQVTRVNAVSGEQAVLTTWRDPFCPACGRHSPAAREWETA